MLGGKPVPDVKCLPTMSEVFTRSEVRGEVPITGEEEPVSDDVEETGTGVVAPPEGTEKGRESVSLINEGSVHDVPSESSPKVEVISEGLRLSLIKEFVSLHEAAEDISEVNVSWDPALLVWIISVDFPSMVGKAENVGMNDEDILDDSRP